MNRRKRLIRDFYLTTGKRTFFTTELIVFADGREYRSDPIFGRNILVGTILKAESRQLGIHEIQAGCSVNQNGVHTKSSKWEIESLVLQQIAAGDEQRKLEKSHQLG
jgi:hypothetical protein